MWGFSLLIFVSRRDFVAGKTIESSQQSNAHSMWSGKLLCQTDSSGRHNSKQFYTSVKSSSSDHTPTSLKLGCVKRACFSLLQVFERRDSYLSTSKNFSSVWKGERGCNEVEEQLSWTGKKSSTCYRTTWNEEVECVCSVQNPMWRIYVYSCQREKRRRRRWANSILLLGFWRVSHMMSLFWCVYIRFFTNFHRRDFILSSDPFLFVSRRHQLLWGSWLFRSVSRFHRSTHTHVTS